MLWMSHPLGTEISPACGHEAVVKASQHGRGEGSPSFDVLCMYVHFKLDAKAKKFKGEKGGKGKGKDFKGKGKGKDGKGQSKSGGGKRAETVLTRAM